MHAGLDSLITLLIFVGIAIVSSIIKNKQKQGSGETGEEAPPMPRRRVPPPPEARQKSWEEELRDLLQNQQPEPAPEPSLPPMRREMPRPSPYVPAPPPLPEPEVPMHLPVPHPNIEPHFQPLAGLADSHARYADASTLQERVSRHMHDVSYHPVGSTSVERHAALTDREARELVRNPKNLRMAILATVILGPPKALEG